MEAEIRQLQGGFKAVEVGMNRQTVIQLMGQPFSEGPEFQLSQREGFEKEYDRASQSGSAYYLIWLGVRDDLTYAVGFDTNSIVTMKAVGGS